MAKGRKDVKSAVDGMTTSVADMLIRVKRDFITKFWTARADILEQQALLLFREAGKLRVLSDQTKTIPDEGVEAVWNDMQQKHMIPDYVKTFVEPEDGTGKVN